MYNVRGISVGREFIHQVVFRTSNGLRRTGLSVRREYIQQLVFRTSNGYFALRTQFTLTKEGHSTLSLFSFMLPLLSIQYLTVQFESAGQLTRAVNNASFEVHKGEILAVVGESGSGKSVTALSILQLVPSPPAQYPSGKILFSIDGEKQVDLLSLSQKELRDIRGNRISMIFQEPMSSLNPVIKCGEQVVEAILAHKHISKEEAKQKAIEWFGKVKLPDPAGIYDRYPHQLSGGQKQRVMIAMAMCCDPSLLICDEPTTALDVTVQKTILTLIKDLQKERQMGVIFITHDLNVVGEIADRAVVMYKGDIVEQGKVEEIFNHATHPYTKGLLACRPSLHPKGERLPVVSDFMEGERSLPPRRASLRRSLLRRDDKGEANNSSRDRKILLKVEDLHVWFPNKKTFLGKVLSYNKAVNGVSFEVYEGETLGLVGESGCGKTTLGRAILRLIEPTSGRIIYNDKDLVQIPREQLNAMRKDVQIVFQDPFSSLNPRITIGAAITEPMKVHGFYSSQKQRKDKAIEILEKVDLKPEHYGRYPHEFSGGQRQRIVIARALGLNPSFLVCDESVSALDVSVQAQVLNLLNDLKKEYGFTIIFISHDLSVVRYISDRIMVMQQGRIVEKGEADNIYYRPQNEYTKKLIASIPKGLN